MHSIAHTYAGPFAVPSEMLGYINARLCRHYVGDTGTFVTAFYGIFDPQTLIFKYSSAGHNPPRLRRHKDGRIESLSLAQSLPLGVTAIFPSVEASVTLTEEELQLNDKLVREGYIQRAQVLRLQRDASDYRSRLSESQGDLALARPGLVRFDGEVRLGHQEGLTEFDEAVTAKKRTKEQAVGAQRPADLNERAGQVVNKLQ